MDHNLRKFFFRSLENSLPRNNSNPDFFCISGSLTARKKILRAKIFLTAPKEIRQKSVIGGRGRAMVAPATRVVGNHPGHSGRLPRRPRRLPRRPPTSPSSLVAPMSSRRSGLPPHRSIPSPPRHDSYRRIPGRQRVVPGVFRVVPGVSPVVPGVFRAVPGVSRVVPGVSRVVPVVAECPAPSRSGAALRRIAASCRVHRPVALRPRRLQWCVRTSRDVSPPMRGAVALTEEPLSLLGSNGKICGCLFFVLPLYRPGKNHTKNEPL